MDYEFSSMKLSLSARLALAAGLFSAGALLQVLFGWGLLPGLIAIVIGYIPLRLKPITNKPADQGLEEWRPVSMAEIDKLADTLRESKAIFGKSIGGSVLMVTLAGAVAIAAGVSLAFSPDLSLILADGLLFAIPAMFFGRVKAFVPHVLSLKMPCFQALFAERIPEHVVVTPYLRFDKDKNGGDVPEDIRLMIEPKRKPDDFVGVQVQAAINKGPSAELPYLYAVILTKGKGASYRRFEDLRASGYEIEAGGDDAYGSIVVRQETSGTGYATKPSDCVRLFNLICGILKA
ncbi:MAG TPA: hypothetical protein VN445_10530 [Rectinemataceae bacterium]|nr:hypothetical protein [Rectinemataceae bacterium]